MADGSWSAWFADVPDTTASNADPGSAPPPSPDTPSFPTPAELMSFNVAPAAMTGLPPAPIDSVDLASGLPSSPLPGLGGPGFVNPVATPDKIPTADGGALLRQGNNWFRMSGDGRTLTPLNIFTEAATGNIVAVSPDGQRVVLSQQGLASIKALADKGDWGAIGKVLGPLNQALGTNLGGTLTALGLGALGLGVSRAVAGPQPRFPAFTPPFTGIAANPQAQALERDIRLKNLAGLARISSRGTDQSLDPITVDLTTRLRKALAGEISNPILARQDALEKSQFENEMLRRTEGSPLWRDSSAGIERGARLDESQAIRRYLDNQNTIGALEPSLRARQAQETNTLTNLSGLNTLDAQRRYEQVLQSQYDYDRFLTESQQRAELAKAIGSMFGTAAGTLGGGRRPWDRVPVTLG